MAYELIEHTADLGLRVWAGSPAALFEESARALMAVMGEVRGSPDRAETVDLEAPDPEALMVDWLSELLYLFEVRRFVPVDVEAVIPARVKGEPWRLRARLSGCDAAGFVQHGPAVKAVTYHDIQVRLTDSEAEARVYLDV